MRVCRRPWAPLVLLLVAAAVADAQDAASPPGPVAAKPVHDAESLRRELADAYHAAPLILVAYEVRRFVGGVQQDVVGRYEAYREGTISAVQMEGEGAKGLVVAGPDDLRAVADARVMVHVQGVRAVEAAVGAYNAALQRLSKGWGHPLPSIRPLESAVSLRLHRAERAGRFRVEMLATRDSRDTPEWLLPDDFRGAIATIVDGGEAVRFEREDEVRVMRRADGMPDLWVLDRPADHARAEVRRVKAARSRDAWAKAVSEALRLDPRGAESTTLLDVLQSKGEHWEVSVLHAALLRLAESWPGWNSDATRRCDAEAELRAAWRDARRALGLPEEPSAEEREALEAAVREGLTAPPPPASAK